VLRQTQCFSSRSQVHGTLLFAQVAWLAISILLVLQLDQSTLTLLLMTIILILMYFCHFSWQFLLSTLLTLLHCSCTLLYASPTHRLTNLNGFMSMPLLPTCLHRLVLKGWSKTFISIHLNTLSTTISVMFVITCSAGLSQRTFRYCQVTQTTHFQPKL